MKVENCELWIHWWAGITCPPFSLVMFYHVPDSCQITFYSVESRGLYFISPVAVKEEQYCLQFVSSEGSRCNTELSMLWYNSVISLQRFLSCHYLSLLMSVSGVLDCQFHPTQPWIFTAGADHLIRLYTWQYSFSSISSWLQSTSGRAQTRRISLRRIN